MNNASFVNNAQHISTMIDAMIAYIRNDDDTSKIARHDFTIINVSSMSHDDTCIVCVTFVTRDDDINQHAIARFRNDELLNCCVVCDHESLCIV